MQSRYDSDFLFLKSHDDRKLKSMMTMETTKMMTGVWMRFVGVDEVCLLVWMRFVGVDEVCLLVWMRFVCWCG